MCIELQGCRGECMETLEDAGCGRNERVVGIAHEGERDLYNSYQQDSFYFFTFDNFMLYT